MLAGSWEWEGSWDKRVLASERLHQVPTLYLDDRLENVTILALVDFIEDKTKPIIIIIIHSTIDCK